MDKFVKGFLSLLVNGASFTLFLVLLPGISTDKSGACSNIFIYLHWLILSSRTKKCSNFVFVQTEMFCPIRRRTQFTTQFFFLLPIVFLCTFKPIDLKMVILFWFDFLSFRLSLLFYINYQKFRIGMRDWTYHRFIIRSWGFVTFLLRKLSPHSADGIWVIRTKNSFRFLFFRSEFWNFLH